MTLALRIWDASDLDDRARWEQLHAAWPAREVFAHPAYLSLFAGAGDRTLAAFAPTPNGWVLYPFILRQVAPGLTDITSPYGYGGPYRTGDAAEYAEPFWTAFAAWTATQGVVSEFVRFSLFDDDLLPYPGERVQKLVNVVRSLEPSAQEIWTDFDHKVRKNVNKATRSGVTVEIDPTGAQLDDFFRIYESTMDRREARRGYYFPRSFFETIGAQLAGQYVYVHARFAGRVVSTELALVSAHTVYSFLGGTEEVAFDQRPNDLLKHELILWAKQAGKRRFVLGGGYAEDDGIFRYKKAFAPTGMLPFHVGHRIFDRASYQQLVEATTAAAQELAPGWQPAPGFFPAYRSPGPSTLRG